MFGDLDLLINEVIASGQPICPDDLKLDVRFGRYGDPDNDMTFNIGRIMGLSGNAHMLFDERLWADVTPAHTFSKSKELYEALPTFAKKRCAQEYEFLRAMASVSMAHRGAKEKAQTRKIPKLR